MRSNSFPFNATASISTFKEGGDKVGFNFFPTNGNEGPHKGAHHFVEEALVLGVTGIDDLPALEAQPDVRHLAALVDGRKGETNLAFGCVLDRPGEHLAVGEVVFAVTVDPPPAFDAEEFASFAGADCTQLDLGL